MCLNMTGYDDHHDLNMILKDPSETESPRKHGISDNSYTTSQETTMQLEQRAPLLYLNSSSKCSQECPVP